jgi:hypothetical protein
MFVQMGASFLHPPIKYELLMIRWKTGAFLCGRHGFTQFHLMGNPFPIPISPVDPISYWCMVAHQQLCFRASVWLYTKPTCSILYCGQYIRHMQGDSFIPSPHKPETDSFQINIRSLSGNRHRDRIPKFWCLWPLCASPTKFGLYKIINKTNEKLLLQNIVVIYLAHNHNKL